MFYDYYLKRLSHEIRMWMDLVEHLSLEGEEVPPPRPDEQAHQLVVNPVVDLQHTENSGFRKKCFRKILHNNSTKQCVNQILNIQLCEFKSQREKGVGLGLSKRP